MAAITAGELAAALKLSLRGDPGAQLKGAATLEQAGGRIGPAAGLLDRERISAAAGRHRIAQA